jgi:hypothetical protein
MPAIRGITISVGYASTLAVCLPRNMRHLTECLVVTSPEDAATQAVAASVPGVRVLVSDAGTRHGARFNKGLLMEEGFDALGREGWLLILDADILLPDHLPLDHLRPTRLHGARRRVLDDPAAWSPELDWRTCAVHRDGGAIGFFQAFHADDPALKGKSPWYDVTFAHAGGGDAYFMGHWPGINRVVLPLEVLHLGTPDRNWFGVDAEGRDLMARFVHQNGWRRAMAKHSPEAVARAGEVVDRVEVPGYPSSSFELPFVRRAKERRG